MNDYIKVLIDENKNATESIEELEALVQSYPVTDEKSKANFGNLCILLNGYRGIAKATECLLINENVLKDDQGNYYQKIEEEEEVVDQPEDKADNGTHK